jgi:hypothetical protein
MTSDGVLGQDQQHLVPQPNSGIDLVEELAADGQVMRRKPAAHPLVLKVSMKAARKVLIIGRVTDEAGIMLDSLSEERRQIVN